MTRYYGHEEVDPGIYFSLEHLSFVSMDETGQLPGSPETAYRRVPAIALLVVGPLVGLAYVIFLPLIGFLMLGRLAVETGWALTRDASRALVRVLEPAWQPARAFLSRSRRKEPEEEKEEVEKAPDEWADDVREELDRRGR